MITTQRELRAAFWQEHPELDAEARRRRTRSKGQNAQTCTTRSMFCFWLDNLRRDGEISDRLSNNATL